MRCGMGKQVEDFQSGSVWILSSDIETRWCSCLEELIGKHFTTSDEFMPNAFLISDYSIKAVKGAQYDVLYRDRKEEEQVGKDEPFGGAG